MIDINFSFPREQVEESNRQIGRLMEVSSKGREHVIKRAMMFVLKSLRATTKEAPKRRKVERADFVQVRRKKEQRNEGGLFKVNRWDRKSGKEKTIVFAADSLAAARDSYLAKIFYAGLAKRSWGWAMRDLFRTAVEEKGFQRRPGIVTTKTEKTMIDYSIRVTDSLRYVDKAFKVKGKQTVDSLLQRASNNIRKDVERALEGRNAWANS